MYPAQFEYFRPTTVDEAVKLLAQHGDDAKLLAGGHSLIPAMKLRLAQPKAVVDLGRIANLSYIRESGGRFAIGAMTTHADVQASSVLRARCPLLPETASHIGDMQVRNKGTIGGSIAHSDPAGDWPAAILALNADLVLVGPNGERVVKAADFFLDLLTTDLRPGEILREIRVEKPSGRFGQAYQKVPHPASGFAVVGVAVHLSLNDDGSCKAAQIGVTGVGAKAYRAQGDEAALAGKSLDDQTISAAVAHVCDGIDPNSDLYASSDYRCHLAQVHAKRAIQAAKAAVQ